MDDFPGRTTLRVYLELLAASRPMGVREVQRRLGFKSPSTSKYHLDKLVEMRLADKTANGKYVAKNDERTVFSLYTSVLGRLVPKLLVYATFSTTMLTAYVISHWPRIDPLVLITCVVPILALWVEGSKILSFIKSLCKG